MPDNQVKKDTESKKTLRQTSINVMEAIEAGKPIKQYTANIYANVISQNLINQWSGYNKIAINLDDSKGDTYFEFIPPAMTQDFVARYVEGRESLTGFLHRRPEIKVRMSPKLFETMKSPDDAYNFFKSAIQYYDNKVAKIGDRISVQVMKCNRNMKYLIAHSTLKGLVVLPLMSVFVFNKADMSNKDCFKITDEHIKSVNKFIGNISSKYASPEKEKKQILDDVKDVIKELRESVTNFNDADATGNLRMLSGFTEALKDYYDNKFDSICESYENKFILENSDGNINEQFSYITESGQLITEKLFVKKLKKIPRDLIAYITIETESIKDSNDKMMIASYCLGKIEIVEWYIELLTVGSKRYIVPHTKPYLESVRTQLLACYKKIMLVKPPMNEKPTEIPWPKGYEG